MLGPIEESRTSQIVVYDEGRALQRSIEPSEAGHLTLYDIVYNKGMRIKCI
jgi:hypothetical protein